MDRSKHEKRGDHPGLPGFPAGLGGQHLVGRHGAVMSQQSIVIFPMSQWILDNVQPSIEALVFDNVQPNAPSYGCRRDDYLDYFF